MKGFRESGIKSVMHGASVKRVCWTPTKMQDSSLTRNGRCCCDCASLVCRNFNLDSFPVMALGSSGESSSTAVSLWPAHGSNCACLCDLYTRVLPKWDAQESGGR